MGKKETKLESSSQKDPRSPLQTQISQKKLIQDQYYFDDSISWQKLSSAKEPSEIAREGHKSIKKQRKQKKHNPEDRFLKQHVKRYYLFPFLYYTENPFFKISWGHWKPNSIYKKMAAVLSQPQIPAKTSVQCKSFDQRMKNEHFVNPAQPSKKDLLQSALAYLEKQQLQAADLEIMEKYVAKMALKSPYMSFLEQPHDSDLPESETINSGCEIKRQDSPFTQGKEHNDILFNEFFDWL